MVEVNNYKCKKCKHEWVSRIKTVPIQCPHCHRNDWEKPTVSGANLSDESGANLSDDIEGLMEYLNYDEKMIKDMKKHVDKFKDLNKKGIEMK